VPYCSRDGSLKVRFMSIGIAILLNQEYRYRYRRYFYAEISLSVSAILFRLYRYRLSAILLLSIVNNSELITHNTTSATKKPKIG
jgi:hypothetical protein